MGKRTVHEVAFRLSHDMSLQITPRLGEIGVDLSAQQMRTMRLIWASAEPVTLVDISKTLKRDKAQIVRLIDSLCRLGVVERVPNPDDGRSKILVLTQSGEDVFRRVEAIEAAFSEQLIDGIPTKDLATFFRVSDHLSRNLKDIDAD